MASINVTIRMDEDIKRQADDLFSDLGMSLSGAITVFVKQAIRQQAIPFKIARYVPNRETLEASLKDRTKKSTRGLLSKYANPELQKEEESAWEKATEEKYGNA